MQPHEHLSSYDIQIFSSFIIIIIINLLPVARKADLQSNLTELEADPSVLEIMF